MAFIQYLKDTRGELNHVAWPTRAQTIIFTILVIAISIFVSLYLGFFDYLFTQALGKIVERFPSAQEQIFEVQTPPEGAVDGIETEPVSGGEGSGEPQIQLENVLPTE